MLHREVLKNGADEKLNPDKRLEQSAEDKKELIRICSISEDQEQYITNNTAGHGLLCAGENLIPFNAEVDIKFEFYKLATTKITEAGNKEKATCFPDLLYGLILFVCSANM